MTNLATFIKAMKEIDFVDLNDNSKIDYSFCILTICNGIHYVLADIDNQDEIPDPIKDMLRFKMSKQIEILNKYIIDDINDV